jgi:trk system potassium uptake protein TrkH
VKSSNTAADRGGKLGGLASRAPHTRSWFTRWHDPAPSQGPEYLWRSLEPTHVFVASFAILVLFGTLGLLILPGLYTGERLGLIDALFTATSAVCVTGLIVVDTATRFTPFGQAFLLLLIQLGGLGMITFATLIILGFGGRLSLRHEELSTAAIHVAPQIDYRHLVRNVVLFTFAAEALGAAFLYFAWAPGLGGAEAIWHAIFQSVSAFCNAGFSTFSDSLTWTRENPLAIGTVSVLIVIGGIGFLTLEELWVVRRHARDVRLRRLSLHSRIVLATTALLLLLGWTGFTFFEWRATLEGMPPWARFMNALFMSITARTAGFNTVDYGQVTESTAFFSIILMFIGGSPGSTAGGIKTTTMALVALLALSRLRGNEYTSAWSRTVPDETIARAVGLFVVGAVLVALAIFLLTAFSPVDPAEGAAGQYFLPRVFEAVSAFATVGLSMGVTPGLDFAGKIVIILLMFIGRVGPLAMAAAIALPLRRTGRFRFAHEDVIVG